MGGGGHARARAPLAMGKRSVTGESRDWQAQAPLNSLMQVRAHLESCKEWLTAPVEQREEEEKGLQTRAEDIAAMLLTPGSSEILVPNLGMPRAAITPVGNFQCFFCGATHPIGDGRILTSNPFTTAQTIVTCQRCVPAKP